MNIDGFLEGIAARPPQGDPEPDWLAEARRKGVEAARVAVQGLDLPERAHALLESGAVRTTEAVLALEKAGGITVLSGLPGCGKTVAAAKWMWDFARQTQRPGGLWVTATRLARWPRYDDREMERLLSAPRLVVDDLGTEFLDVGGSFMATLDEVINERYAKRRPTVITTNLNATTFKARYEERIVDRIREDGQFVVIASPSLRSA
jgi:DNA replication protein DnaC